MVVFNVDSLSSIKARLSRLCKVLPQNLVLVDIVQAQFRVRPAFASVRVAVMTRRVTSVLSRPAHGCLMPRSAGWILESTSYNGDLMIVPTNALLSAVNPGRGADVERPERQLHLCIRIPRGGDQRQEAQK